MILHSHEVTIKLVDQLKVRQDRLINNLVVRVIVVNKISHSVSNNHIYMLYMLVCQPVVSQQLLIGLLVSFSRYLYRVYTSNQPQRPQKEGNSACFVKYSHQNYTAKNSVLSDQAFPETWANVRHKVFQYWLVKFNIIFDILFSAKSHPLFTANGDL